MHCDIRWRNERGCTSASRRCHTTTKAYKRVHMLNIYMLHSTHMMQCDATRRVCALISHKCGRLARWLLIAWALLVPACWATSCCTTAAATRLQSVCVCVCVHVHVLMHAGTHGAKSRSGGVCRIRVFTHEMLAADARWCWAAGRRHWIQIHKTFCKLLDNLRTMVPHIFRAHAYFTNCAFKRNFHYYRDLQWTNFYNYNMWLCLLLIICVRVCVCLATSNYSTCTWIRNVFLWATTTYGNRWAHTPRIHFKLYANPVLYTR